MQLTSDSFRNRGTMPAVCAAIAGGNRHPQLRWYEAPAGTASLALVCLQADAPGGDLLHWAVVDIPPGLDALAEGMLANVPQTHAAGMPLRQGLNDFQRLGYHGPAPTPGRTHYYIFRIYALDVARLALPAGFRCADVLDAIYGHIIDEAQLIGAYTHI